MIFKEEDCIDLAKNKKAIQSSISKWSRIDDASRACKEKLVVDDFAFHTGLENNPWWMLDLEQIEDIDCIRITNRKNKKYQERLKKVKVELSLDAITWTLVDSNMFDWNGLEYLDVDIYQTSRARFIRISLTTQTHFALSKVEVFVRKVKGYIVAARPDGLGMRLSALVNAMYISKKINYKFLFTWLPYTDTDHMGAASGGNNIAFSGEILKAENVFNCEFLKKHYINIKEQSYDNDLLDLVLYNENSFLKRNWGIFTGFQLPYTVIKNINKDDCLKELSECYLSIQWSENCINILKDIEHIVKNLGDFIAIHLRGGEVVNGDFRIAPDVWSYGRHFPYEIAIEIINMKLKENSNIIIFGQDFNSNMKLEKYFNNDNVISVDSLLLKKYSNETRAFLELNLLSKAKQIFMTGGSIFSRFASVIAGRELGKPLYDIFSDKTMYEIILKNFNSLELSNFQKAYSCYRLYDLSLKLNLDIDTSLYHLKEALKYDDSNDYYRIATIKCLFVKKEYLTIEKNIKEIINTRLNCFLEALYGPHTRYKRVENIYNTFYNYYTTFSDKENFPYISFIAAKIMNYKQNKQKAIEFLTYSLNKESDNKVFIDFMKELNSCFSTNIIKEINSNNVGAVERVKNHLSYKIGKEIVSCKTFIECIKLPFILINITKTHNNKIQEKSLKLSEYSDYKEALKEKECFTYKLGEAFIKASKNWYKGGYIVFIFKDISRLRKIINKKEL